MTQRSERIFPTIIVILVALIFLFLIIIELISRDAFLPVFLAAIAVAAFVVIVAAFLMKFVLLPWWVLRFNHDAEVMEHQRSMARLQLESGRAQALPAPAHEAARGIQFTSLEPRTLSVNLILYSIRLYGESSNLIASWPDCHPLGCSGRMWDRAVHKYLEPNYGVVTTPGPHDNGGGTYVPEEIGTLKNLYDKLLLDGAVSTLPRKGS